MPPKEFSLFLDGLKNRDSIINLLLRPAFDAKVSKLQRINVSLQ